MQEVGTSDSAVATAHKPEIPTFEHTTLKNYHAVKLDITDPSDSQSAFVIALDRFGRVDMVVNNKGDSGPFEELSDSQIRTQIGVNFFGLINITRTAVEATPSATQRMTT